ncbi:MAG: response regulator [Pyrinomonadaceae bacterium]
MESAVKANILLVDDRPENLLAMETVLQDLGQNLVRASSAREALRFLLHEDVALILLDVQMPGVNGFELAELIRERERTQHTPIIFVSAVHDNEQYIFKGYSLGAVDYLTKPVDPEIVRSKARFFIKLFRQNEQIKRQAALLEESNARLDSLNIDLEIRVAERTKELKSANLELEREIDVRIKSEAREKTLREMAEESSRLKDEFLATVSHELRTPLNSILGWGQIIQDGKLSPEEQKNALETIHRNAKSQAQLIDDLLDTSRLITGNLRLDLSLTAVIPTIENAIEVVHPAADAKCISISTEFTSDVESITCDPNRLKQMIWNLLTNAVKFTPKDGCVDIKYQRSGDFVQIVVSDTGHGISAEFLPFVFDRFRQADSSSTRCSEGVGLGLSIVRHLAELHGGKASVSSEGPGTGAAFTISLPLSRVDSPTTEKAYPESNGSRHVDPNRKLDGVQVLLIDDDKDAREMMSFALELSGAKVNTCSSVPEAFELIATVPFDVLLADINMPGEDGYSFIGKLRNLTLENGANIPAIALTAMARPEDRERALSAGFEVHVSKPVDIDELSAAIIEIAAKELPVDVYQKL